MAWSKYCNLIYSVEWFYWRWAVLWLLQCLWSNFEGHWENKSHKSHNSLQSRHKGRESVSNYQPHHCLLNRLFRRRSKKTSKARVTGLCAGNSPLTGEFPAHMSSNAENAFIWWRPHVFPHCNQDLKTHNKAIHMLQAMLLLRYVILEFFFQTRSFLWPNSCDITAIWH